MSFKSGRVDEVIFGPDKLIGIGSYFNIYSPNSVNGEVVSISVGSNNFVNIGSLAFYFSGTSNDVQDNLILRIRAGSMMQTFYPNVYTVDNQGALGSATNSPAQGMFVGNAPLRIVGSGIGDGQSGLFVSVKYR